MIAPLTNDWTMLKKIKNKGTSLAMNFVCSTILLNQDELEKVLQNNSLTLLR